MSILLIYLEIFKELNQNPRAFVEDSRVIAFYTFHQEVSTNNEAEPEENISIAEILINTRKFTDER